MSIEVQQLVKHFPDRKKGKIEAVQEVSFTCRPGAIFGLLGLNGAGKTTILRTICTILQPVAGRVTVYGFDTTKQPDEVRRRIGFLPAGGGLYSHFTPREVLRYFAKLCKYPDDKVEQRVTEIISTLHMEEFADKYCKGLSSGMTQKVCLGRAIVHDPPVVIFDEPTNSLDVLTRVAVHNLIRKCRKEGKCVILSTHIMSEAEKLCDDIAILHKGKILAAGTLDQLREQTGLHYLEDIFVRFVGEGSDEME